MARPRKDTISRERLRELAALGAQSQVESLRAQIREIEREFPEVRVSRSADRADAAPAAGGSRRAYRMSAAARREVSVRMKRYWAARRKEKAAKGR